MIDSKNKPETRPSSWRDARTLGPKAARRMRCGRIFRRFDGRWRFLGARKHPSQNLAEFSMIVTDIMSRTVVTVELDDRLETVKEIFDKLHFHHLLVVDEYRLFGVVSDRDLLKALSPNLGTSTETVRDAATLNKRVHQIMSRKPLTLHPGADVLDAMQLFVSNRISCIPIVDDGGRPVGILSWRDVFKALLQRR